jgi:isoquinoline 1-oxidoreductase beta subunit
VRCPEIGGRLRRYDAAAARAMPGVEQVVEITTGVAVVARDAWTALRGRERLVVEWQSGRQAELSHERLYAELEGAAGRRGEPLRDTGQVERTLKAAAHVERAHYLTPLLAHATLEPMNCVAEVSDDGCDIWVGTQSQSDTQAVAANLTGLARRKVRVHTQFLGGGFGRRLETDFVAEAVELAAKLRQPVQVLWTRADDLRHALYRPAGLVAIEAALGDDGLPQAWRTRLVGDALVTQGIRPLLYRLPHFREEHVEVKSPLPAAAWRAVGAPQHAFAVESFVDELAFAGGTDPLDYRRALLVDAPRLRGTLELAVDAGRWGRALPPGHGRGLACYQSFGSYAAAVVELRVAAGAIQVTRVACALDCGRVVNPDAVRAQLEGSVAMGLSAALKEELRIEAGRVAHQSLADYPILTLAEMPEVEVLLVPSDEPPGGVGEPGVPVIAPAVANAVFAATGRRLRRLPLRMP